MSLEHHPNVFQKVQVCELFQITPRMLSYWTDNVFTVEKISASSKLNFRDLCMVSCVVHMRNQLGKSIQSIRSKYMPRVEHDVNRARASGRSMTDLKVTLWKEAIFVYDGNIHSDLAGWREATVDFKELWDSVRGIKVQMQQFKEDFG